MQSLRASLAQRKYLLMSCSAGILLGFPAVPAYAQASSQPAEASKASGLEEIVVTARKVAENLQDVPVSVTALSGDRLAEMSVTRLSDISAATPGLTIATSPGGLTVFSLRGQFQKSSAATTDPSVGVYVDGVYWARSFGMDSDLLDVENLQVLRGPQGTLFGRNTTGGAVLVSTRNPDTSRLSGELFGSYGRFDDKVGRFIINVPIIEGKLALRAAYQRRHSDGYINDPLHPSSKYGQHRTESARLKLLGNITDNLSLLLSADLYTLNQLDTPPQLLFVPSTAASNLEAGAETLGAAACFASTVNCASAGATAISDYIKRYSDSDTAPMNITPRLGIHTQTYTGTLSLDTSFGNAKIISGYRRVRVSSFIDYDGSSFSIAHLNMGQNVAQWSVEGQVTGKAFGDRLSFASGVFYFSESGYDFSHFGAVPQLGPPVSQFYGNISNDSVGVYGQADYEITDKLTLTGGLRWSRDGKSVVLNNGSFGGDIENLGAFTCTMSSGCPKRLSASFSGISYTAGVDYKFSRDVMTYAKVSHGYRSGGLNLRETTTLPGVEFKPFKPEQSTSFEAGVKSTFLDNRIRLNGAGFYTITKDLQREFTISTNGVLATIAANAGRADFYGGEAELEAQVLDGPVDKLRLSGNVAYVHAKYVDFHDAQTGFDRSREYQPYVAPWQFSIASTYTRDLKFAEFEISGQYNWQAAFQKSEFNYYTDENGVTRDASSGAAVALSDAQGIVRALKKPAAGILNARAALKFSEGRYELAIWGRNITNNRDHYERANANTLFVAGIRREPVTYGVSGTLKF